MVEIRVPATSANIGVGFDCLGVALSMYTTVKVGFSEENIITGTDEKYCNDQNLILKSYVETCKLIGVEVKNISIEINSDIPICRGLGSSAACVVVGVCAAFTLNNLKYNKEDIAQIATKIEGHPDNVIPAIYGGLWACSEEFNVEYNINDAIKFLAIVPGYEISTKDARGVLSKTIDFKDAISNLSKLPILLKGLEEMDGLKIKSGLEDKLHQPYRIPLLAEFEEVKNICSNIDSLGFFISGSGSTLINLVDSDKNISEIKQGLDKLSCSWESTLLSVDREGLVVKIH